MKKTYLLLLVLGLVTTNLKAEETGRPYIGLTAGIANADMNLGCSQCDPAHTYSDFGIGDSTKQSDNRGFGGLRAGYEFTASNFYYGIEASYLNLNLKDKTWSKVESQDDTFRSKINSTFLFTGKLGKQFDNLKVFAKAGLAVADYKLEIKDYNTTIDGTQTGNSTGGGDKSHWVYGYAIGAGAEYLINNSVSVGLEYTRLDFNSKNFNAGGTVDYVMKTKDFTADIYQLNLNYYF